VGSSLTSRPSAAIACQRPMDSYLGLAGTTGEGNYAAAREGDKVLTAKTSAENVISLMDVLKRISLMDVLKRSLAAESPAARVSTTKTAARRMAASSKGSPSKRSNTRALD
jgi:hydrogenase maturation factor